MHFIQLDLFVYFNIFYLAPFRSTFEAIDILIERVPCCVFNGDRLLQEAPD